MMIAINFDTEKEKREGPMQTDEILRVPPFSLYTIAPSGDDDPPAF